MKKYFSLILLATLSFYSSHILAQCTVSVTAFPTEVVCGDCVRLTTFGQGQGLQVFGEDFNSGTPTGWSFTQQALFTNPCSPGGVDGTTHIWMGNSSGVPRSLETLAYDFTSAVAGATVCFDMLFATQGNNEPCEGPDLPAEGVYLQYSIDGGSTWNTIHYFDPNGGNDPQLTNWNNWCFELPPDAITAQTQIRWFQDNDSGPEFDHWGIDNVNIYFNDPTYEIIVDNTGFSFGVGNSGGTTGPICPRVTTDYIVSMSNGSKSCSDTVRVNVVAPAVVVDAGPDLRVCEDECATINATAKVVKRPASTPTFSDAQTTQISGTLGSTSSIDVNVTGLNMNNILPGSITQVCITGLTFFGFSIIPPAIQTIGDLNIFLVCPDGTKVLLIPSGQTTSSTPLTGYTNTCFTPAATADIANASEPYSGTFMSGEPLSNLVGCTANGVWSIEVATTTGVGVGLGTFNGWSITFDDPEISYTAEFSWEPTAGLSDSNSLQPTVCPEQDLIYTLTASDTAECVTLSDTVQITVDTTDLNIAAALTNSNCDSSNGSIIISVTNGSGNYLYSWSNGSTTKDLLDVPAGVYSVTITDPAHCQEDTMFTISDIDGPAIDSIWSTPESCFRQANGTATVQATGAGTLNYTWSNSQTGSTITNLAPGTYQVTVRDNAGCQSVAQVTVKGGNNIILSQMVTDESCVNACNGEISIGVSGAVGAIEYDWSDVGISPSNRTGLCAGNYRVTVTDANGCSDSTIAVVKSGAGIATIELGDTITLCQGSMLDAGSGYDDYLWSTGEITQSIMISQSSDYSVTVTVANCNATVSDTVYVQVLSSPVIDAGDDITILEGDSIMLNALVAGNPEGAFLWEPNALLSCDTCASTLFTPPAETLDSFTYVVTFFDSLECSASDTITITVIPRNVTPVFPTAFVPNGTNDLNRKIRVLPESLEMKEFKVYNRWGQIVHDNPSVGWDGEYLGEPQPMGTYSYFAVVVLPEGEEQRISGAFTLLR